MALFDRNLEVTEMMKMDTLLAPGCFSHSTITIRQIKEDIVVLVCVEFICSLIWFLKAFCFVDRIELFYGEPQKVLSLDSICVVHKGTDRETHLCVDSTGTKFSLSIARGSVLVPHILNAGIVLCHLEEFGVCGVPQVFLSGRTELGSALCCSWIEGISLWHLVVEQGPLEQSMVMCAGLPNQLLGGFGDRAG